MKYLIISDEYRPVIGGIARVAAALADGLVERGHQVTVLTNGTRAATDDFESEKAEIELYRKPAIALLGKMYLSAWWPVWFGRWIRRKAFDRVLVIDPANALPLPIISVFGKIDYEILLHGSELVRYSQKRWTRLLFRRSLRRATRLFSTTQFVARELQTRFGNASHLTSCGIGERFLTDGVDPEKLGQTRGRYGFSPSDFVIGTISRLDRRKGNDIVIEAVRKLAPRFSNLKYLIGGLGPQHDHLRDTISQLGLSDRVVLAGRISEDELVTHYDMLDAYVMPNRWLTDKTVEGFGISFAEAASRGVPSIGVDNGGVAESVASGVSGVLLSRPDPDELADALSQMIQGKMVFDSEAVRQHGRQFTWDRFVDRIIAPTDAVCGRQNMPQAA